MENKSSKYFKYAFGEIILVVIGILIALQINNWNENRSKTDLGHQYLSEMSTELYGDVITLNDMIARLKTNINNHEAALNTKDINKLPLDSLEMIIASSNVDFNISELTFNKMNNLGLTALSNNDNLNYSIADYYNRNLGYFKRAMIYINTKLVRRVMFYTYEQDKIDFATSSVEEREFPSLHKQSEEASHQELKLNIIEFLYSTKGKNIVKDDLSGKRYSLEVLNNFKQATITLFKAIYKELKAHGLQKGPFLFPSDIDFKEIQLSKDVLENYVGVYQGDGGTINVIVEDMHLYVDWSNGYKIEIKTYENNRFIMINPIAVVEMLFNKEKGAIVSISFIGEEENKDEDPIFFKN